ncbi:MAG TPA: hypothetical protein VF467_03245 [Afipia sp.]
MARAVVAAMADFVGTIGAPIFLTYFGCAIRTAVFLANFGRAIGPAILLANFGGAIRLTVFLADVARRIIGAVTGEGIGRDGESGESGRRDTGDLERLGHPASP